MADQDFYTLNFGDEATVRFKSEKELVAWAKSQTTDWSGLANSPGISRNVIGDFNQLLGAIVQNGQSVIDHPEDGANRSRTTQALGKLEVAISNGKYINSGGELGKFILSEYEINPELGGEILLAAVTPNASNLSNRVGSHIGVSILTGFVRGTDSASAAKTRKSLNALSKKFGADLISLKTDSDLRLETLDRAIKKREVKVEQSTSNLARILSRYKTNLREEQFQLRKDSKDKLDTLIGDAKAEISAFSETLKTEMALKAPIQYWQSKRWWHRIGTGISGVVFLLFCIAAIGYLNKFLLSFEGGLAGFLEFWKGASIGAFGTFAGLLALGLAFARILYRMFASQLHLWNDSSERVTMIQTYLALSERGHNKEEFLGALMRRLFSPSSDGVVKDDFGSLGPIDHISKQLSK